MPEISTTSLYGEEGKETAAHFVVQKDKMGRLITPTPREKTLDMLRSIIAKNSPTPLKDLVIKPISDEKIEAAIDRAISAERHPRTQRKTRPVGSVHKDKFDRAMRAANLYQDFLKVGYNGMSDAQKQIYRQKAWEAIRRIYPDVVRAWAGMTDDQQKRQMDRILSDPAFAKYVATIFEEVVDGAPEPKKLPQELLDRVSQTKLEYDTKQHDTNWVQRDYDRLRVEYDREYVIKDPGSRGADLDAMQPMVVLEREYANAVNTLNREKARLDQLHDLLAVAQRIRDPATQATEVTRINGEIASQQIIINTAQQAVDAAAADRDKRKALEDDKKRLEEALRQLEQELDKKQIELRQAETAYFDALADKNDAEQDILRAEREFIETLESVFEKATEKWVQEELQHYEEARDQLLRESGDQALADGLQRRWTIKRGKKAPEFNKRTINNDYSELIRNGPDNVIIRTLVDGGMSEEDARLKLENDTQFRERATQAVVERLLTRRLQTGKITEAEAMRIIDSPWGANAIQKALEQRAKYTGEINKLREAGLLDGGFINKLKSLPHNKLLLILAVLFGLGVYSIGIGPLIGLVGEGVNQVRQNYGQIGKLL